MVRFPSFYPDPATPREEYDDWLGLALPDQEFELNRDYMPVGLIVEWDRNNVKRYGIILPDPRGGRLIGALYQEVRIC